MQNAAFITDSPFLVQQTTYAPEPMKNENSHQGEFAQVLSSKLNDHAENEYASKEDFKKNAQDNTAKDQNTAEEAENGTIANGQKPDEPRGEGEKCFQGLPDQLKLAKEFRVSEILYGVGKAKEFPHAILNSQNAAAAVEQSKLKSEEKDSKKRLSLKSGMEMISKNLDKASSSKAMEFNPGKSHQLKETQNEVFQLDKPVNMKNLQKPVDNQVNKVNKSNIASLENHGRQMAEHNLEINGNEPDSRKDLAGKIHDKSFARIVQDISPNMTSDIGRSSTVTSAVRPEASTLHNSSWQVIQQIVQKTQTYVNQNKTYMEIQLKPEFLGRVKVHLTYSDGLVTASLTADKSHTGSLLNSAMQQIRNAMQEQGIKVEYLGVNVGGHEGDTFNEKNQHQENSRNYNDLTIKTLSDHVLNVNQGETANINSQITGVNYLA